MPNLDDELLVRRFLEDTNRVADVRKDVQRVARRAAHNGAICDEGAAEFVELFDAMCELLNESLEIDYPTLRVR